MFDTHHPLKCFGSGMGLLPTALGSLRVALLGTLLLTIAQTVTAQTLTTLYSFKGGADGGFPSSKLTPDAQGNLYGTTSVGGVYGHGALFAVAPSGAEKVLYSFRAGGGSSPSGGLIWDANGNLYGVTGGGHHRPNSKACYGTAYELKANGTKKLLYCFKPPVNGATPLGGLIRDGQGNVYGITAYGGLYGYGTLFKVTSIGNETVLHHFGQGVDGVVPGGGLIQDAQGNFYGTTQGGGSYSGGTVFELTSSTYTVLYNFSSSGVGDGNFPFAPLLLDTQGNLYGTTGHGGAYDDGVVFKPTPTGTETIIHSFNLTDGRLPVAGLIHDDQGNLYGAAHDGGAYGYGTAFRITPSGETTVLHDFTGGADGGNPETELVWDTQGNLYGTAKDGGGHGYGI